jgi:hypothetical protein
VPKRKRITPSEKDVERSIIDYVRTVCRGEVDEFSQRRRGRCHRCGQSIPAGTQQTPGISDLRLVFVEQGMLIWCEVKTGRRLETDWQARFLMREIAAGGMGVCVWSLHDLMWALDQFGIDPKLEWDAETPPHERTAFWVELWKDANS